LDQETFQVRGLDGQLPARSGYAGCPRPSFEATRPGMPA